MKGQPNIHQTIGLLALKKFIWDNQDVRDDGVCGPMNCYSRWVNTPGTLSDYLWKKMISQRMGDTSSTNIFDTRPNEKDPLSKEKKGKWRRPREGAGTTARS